MKVCRVIGMLALSVVLCSCAGKQQPTVSEQPQQEYAGVSRLEGVSIETVRKEPKVASGYENIVLNPMQMSAQFASDYPDMEDQFQVSMIRHLKDKKAYKYVNASDLIDHPPNGRTLIADVTLIDMRIVSNGARMLAGPMAGSSYMDLYLKLTDAANQKVIHEQVITTRNNAFASSWALGSESALPMDMGKIIGEYVYTVAPAL